MDPSDELEKGAISFTPGIQATSILPDHYAIFFRDFEI